MPSFTRPVIRVAIRISSFSNASTRHQKRRVYTNSFGGDDLKKTASVTLPHRVSSSPSVLSSLKLNVATASMPKRDKRSSTLFPDEFLTYWQGDLHGVSAGDDAYVFGRHYLGIADGVGAWNTKEKGRPGLWARLLLHYWAVECEERMSQYKPNHIEKTRRNTLLTRHQGLLDEDNVDVISMLQRAFLRTTVDMDITGGWLGSTTACVAFLQSSTLRIANIGDSRAFVIRDKGLHFTTTEQQHWYDCPYQLGTNSVDTPIGDATLHVLTLLPSDIIIIASDGLSDNLWDEEIVAEASGLGTTDPVWKQRSVKDIADSLCRRARTVGEDPWAESPFMEKAIIEGLPFQGGKLDDISVVVARAELDDDNWDISQYG